MLTLSLSNSSLALDGGDVFSDRRGRRRRRRRENGGGKVLGNLGPLNLENRSRPSPTDHGDYHPAIAMQMPVNSHAAAHVRARARVIGPPAAVASTFRPFLSPYRSALKRRVSVFLPCASAHPSVPSLPWPSLACSSSRKGEKKDHRKGKRN